MNYSSPRDEGLTLFDFSKAPAMASSDSAFPIATIPRHDPTVPFGTNLSVGFYLQPPVLTSRTLELSPDPYNAPADHSPRIYYPNPTPGSPYNHDTEWLNSPYALNALALNLGTQVVGGAFSNHKWSLIIK